MRLYELEQQPTGRPEIFLDMDGVLADFFSEYAKLAGVPADVKSGRADYRSIPAELREPAIDQMRGTDFFYRLPKFPSADRLVAMVVEVFGYYNICSSPLRGDNKNSEAMKRAWIAENLDPQPRVIRITGRKGQYAKQTDGTPNILVDDRNSVLTEWEQSGGIGIKYQADENGLDTVASGLRRAFEIVKGRREHTPQNIQSKDYGKMIAGPQDKQQDKSLKEFVGPAGDDDGSEPTPSGDFPKFRKIISTELAKLGFKTKRLHPNLKGGFGCIRQRDENTLDAIMFVPITDNDVLVKQGSIEDGRPYFDTGPDFMYSVNATVDDAIFCLTKIEQDYDLL